LAHMRIFRALTAPLALAVLAMPIGGAHAAIFGDDEARKAILELRDNLAESNRQQHDAMDALAKRIEQLENRIDALQHGLSESASKNDATLVELAKLRGATEELANEVSTGQKREKDLYADIDARLHKLEPTTVTVDGHNATVERDEQLSYEAAMGLFRGNDFRGAINALSAFVARYPQSVYGPTAQFWLGSSYYAVKDFPASVSAQSALLERYPDSPRVPEALLNIAASQIELNDRKGARATLSRIINDYPNSDAAKLANERLATIPAEKEKLAAKEKTPAKDKVPTKDKAPGKDKAPIKDNN